MCKINKRIDKTLCGVNGCVYTICSKTLRHNIVNNLNHCKQCVAASRTLDITDGFERIYDPENNEDCVSASDKSSDEDDVVSTVKTIKSVVYNTVFDKLSESNVPQNIDKIADTIAIPESDTLKPIIPNDDFTSNWCDESDNDSDVVSLYEYTK